MARRETHNPADATLSLRNKNSPSFDIYARRWRVGFQRGEIVIEDKGVEIGRVPYPSGANVPRAEMTIRIVGQRGVLFLSLSLALPGPLGPVGRDQNPLPRERIESSMRRTLHDLVGKIGCRRIAHSVSGFAHWVRVSLPAQRLRHPRFHRSRSWASVPFLLRNRVPVFAGLLAREQPLRG